jgi:hypothetical protein
MLTLLTPILDKFLDAYKSEKKVIRNDRDAMIDLYLYFSFFMDDLIAKNKREKNKYMKLKKSGLDYIKINSKKIIKQLHK